jgi:hypothetical protein
MPCSIILDRGRRVKDPSCKLDSRRRRVTVVLSRSGAFPARCDGETQSARGKRFRVRTAQARDEDGPARDAPGRAEAIFEERPAAPDRAALA